MNYRKLLAEKSRLEARLREINTIIAEHFADRWRDDSSPKMEFKTATSPIAA